MAELLKDVDTLLSRLEKTEKTISFKIEKATKDAFGQAFIGARLRFLSMVEENANKMELAGRHCAAQIGNQLNSDGAKFLAACEAWKSAMKRLVVVVLIVGFVAGMGGGLVAIKLLGAL